MKLARKFDPSGHRTMGVVTKVDKADAGIASRLTAMGPNDLKLTLGLVAVSTLALYPNKVQCILPCKHCSIALL